jgi:hypothetical protein
MTITTNIDKTARTARQSGEMQRDSYEALAKSFSTLQRRNVEFAQTWMTGGVELMRAYGNLFSPFAYARQGIKAAQQTTQHTQQALQATQEKLRVAEEATIKAEEATVRAKKATEWATVKAEKAEQVTAKITANTQAATREAALRNEEETREAALQAAIHTSL